jgi:hypothetical protein
MASTGRLGIFSHVTFNRAKKSAKGRRVSLLDFTSSSFGFTFYPIETTYKSRHRFRQPAKPIVGKPNSRVNRKTRKTTMDHQQFASHATSTVAARREAQQGEDSLSPLEQEVLDEYAKLVGNLDDVSLRPSFNIHPFSPLQVE